MKKFFNKNTILDNLLLIFFILVFGLWVYMQLKCLIEIDFWLTIISLIVTLLIFFISYKIITKINLSNKYVEIFSVALIIILGIFLRIMTNNIMKTLPVSDFNTPHYVYQNQDNLFSPKDNYSDLNFYQLYYSRFPAWFPYMKIVSLIYDLFGMKLMYIKIFNWILYVITGLVIYKICKQNFSNKNGIFALLLFSIFPSLVVYSNITTPDHITIFLFVCLIWSYSNMIKYRDNDKHKLLLYSILNIVIVCFINLFKPTLVLGILVFLFAEIICYINPVIFNKEKRKLYFKNSMKYVFLFLAIFVIAVSSSGKLLNKYVEKNINTEVVNSTGLYLLWGYSIDNNGKYNPDIATEIFSRILDKYDYNQKLAMDEINDLAKQQFIDNLPYFSSIIFQKSKILFTNDNDIFSFANYSANEEYQNLVELNYKKMYTFTANSFLIILLFYVIYSIIKEIKNENKNKLITVMCLIIMGYISMLLLGGVQSRYKTLIYGVICILSCIGIKFKKKEI